jgi:3-hydroxyacyl-CoA dehydrogenase
VEAARLETDPARRLRALLAADDSAGTFLWRLISDGLRYAAGVGPTIADDVVSVDRAMRWGFGHGRGPFETWDLLGPAWVADRLRADGAAVPPLVEEVSSEGGTFYRDGQGDGDGTAPEALVFGEASRFERVEARPGTVDLAARKRAASLPATASASLVDLGEGILGVELHGKLNVIGPDTLDLLGRGIELAAQRYDGMVVGTLAADFSAGANLALLLLEAEEGEWDVLDGEIRRFQAVTRGMRSAPIPVVVAPRGRTLGGGAEFCLAADHCQALNETYIGLVEVGVGLIPAAGGSTEMAARAAARIPEGVPADLLPFFRHALETIAFAKVATSAAEARTLGLFSPATGVTADPDRQWSDAAATARHLAEIGYRPPGERRISVIGRRGIAAAEALTYNELLARHISEHDRKIVLELAAVLSGGDVAEGTLVPEQDLLDLERQAFLRLLGEPLTRERIRHTLKTGKPLRN